jgi:hypothetical protein
LFKLNLIGIQYLKYLDIKEIKTPVKPLTLQKGQLGLVEGHKILTLTPTLLTPTLDPCTSLEICEQIVKIACMFNACCQYLANITPNWYPCELGYLFQHYTYLQIMSIILHLTCVELEQAPRNWVLNTCQSLQGGKADEMIS